MSQLKLKGATSGDVTLKCADVAGTTTATFPATTGNVVTTGDSGTVTEPMLSTDAAGSTGQFLQKSGASTMTWATIDSITEGNTTVECVDTGSDGHITFDTEGSERMRITSGGRVGINETSPDTKLHVRNDNSAAAKFGGHGSGEYYMEIGQLGSSSSPGFNATGSTASMLFQVAGTERMRILHTDGRLLVGTTTALQNGGHSFSYSESTGIGAVVVSNTNTGASTPAASFATATNSTATSNFLIKFFVNGFGAGSGAIVANGTSQAAFGTYSDERLKENIVNLPSQLENIKNLRPVEFDYKTGGHQIGFVAQEFQTVYPDAVGSVKSEDDPDVEFLTISGWSKTEARLVKALQEAIAKIETLETKVAALEAG